MFKSVIPSRSFPSAARTAFRVRSPALCLSLGLLLLGSAGCEHYLTPKIRRDLQLPNADSATASPYAAKTCTEIYAEIYRLFPASYADTHEFLNDQRNAGIGVLGAVFEPAFLGFGYTATTDYLARRRVDVASAELDELRKASALKECWLR